MPEITPETMPETDEPEEEEQEVFACERCGNSVPTDETYCVGGSQWCQSCMENHSSTCDRCEERIPRDDACSVGDQTWCDSCTHDHASRCNSCSDMVDDDDAISLRRGALRQSCYEDGYFTCDGCNEVCHNDDYGEDGYCQDCSESNDSDSIMKHDADVCKVLGVNPGRRRLLYGIELEVESANGDKDDDARRCREMLGESYCITKHDGSLGDGGFEIVTIPSTLADHIEHFTRFLDRRPFRLRSWESGNCGMHIHVSRRPLSPLTIGKILVFMNADENHSFVASVAGRASQQWAKTSPKKISDARKYASDRYQAVNLQNSETIEFRIFRGTLKTSSFVKNLEFVASVVRYCKDHAGINQLDAASFLSWFRRFRKDYPALDSWLVSKSLLAPRSKPRKAVS